MTDLVKRARAFATLAHEGIGHRRKYSNQPYVTHLNAVAERVGTVTDDPEMLAAAWLHDVVEDTPTTLDEVEREFGANVAGLVKELTDVSRPGDGNRAARKAIDRVHLAAASARAQTIKLADLIDNARDICAADAKFSRVYLREMDALLEVLGLGEPRLMRKARDLLAQCRARLEEDAAPLSLEPAKVTEAQAAQLRAVRRQMHGFCVRDLARPLPSLDADQPARVAARLMHERGWSVIGLRRDGRVEGYLRLEDAKSGACDRALRPFEPAQMLDSGATLGAMVQVLTQYEHAFVRVLGEVGGVLERADLHQPIGRMWLFGMVTSVDLELSARIRQHWQGESWRELLTPGRLEKARSLQAERRKRGQAVELLDCLQLSDKAAIVIENPSLIAEWGFSSKGGAETRLRDLESLRNHLAHSQDFVDQHWMQIVRVSQRFEEALSAPGLLA